MPDKASFVPEVCALRRAIAEAIEIKPGCLLDTHGRATRMLALLDVLSLVIALDRESFPNEELVYVRTFLKKQVADYIADCANALELTDPLFAQITQAHGSWTCPRCNSVRRRFSSCHCPAHAPKAERVP
jgi:hypothetical protein